MKRLRLLVVTAVALALVGSGTSVRSQSGHDLVEQCKANGGSPSMCRGLWQLLRVPGGACRDVSSNNPTCAFFDGITIDEALVLANEQSWLTEALALQRGLDDDEPLQDELWPHTHNSFNADAYDFQALGGLDRNHIYSITDQLRMGARAIEVDIHWAPHVTSGGGKAVQVCHGSAIALPVGGFYHAGCELNSPLLPDVLGEIRTWMQLHPDEIVMLYLQNELDEDPAAHAAAAAALETEFDDLVYRPASECAEIPMDTTREQIRRSGARILITGNCGAGGAWGTWVHERGARWKESGLGDGDDFPAYPCAKTRADENYDHNWIRHWGDETGLSASAQSGGDVTPTDALNMTRCGVNMIGWDNLVPFDARMENLVWSWRTKEPSTSKTGYCSSHEADGRFVAKKCRGASKKVGAKQRFACFDGTQWAVTKAKGAWSRGDRTCKAEGLGSFSVPWNGYENERLKEAKGASPGAVWLRYRSSHGDWVS